MTWIGLDIGGANVKAADGHAGAKTRAFALWRHPDRLVRELRVLLDGFSRPGGFAITMTGELCDCFATKAEGVRHILAAVAEVAGSTPVRVWTTAGRFVDLDEANRNPAPIAAANWLALATWSGSLVARREALVLDIGSTTADIVPLHDGVPVPIGYDDPARLASGELVYCGVRRTPLCALFGLARAAEFFATTQDVYLVLGELPEEPDCTDTADGRPATIPHALARLARMDCDEPGDGSRPRSIARQARDIQVDHLARTVNRVAGRLTAPVEHVVLAGSGEFLWQHVLHRAGLDRVATISLSQRLGIEGSSAACAHAVAALAENVG